MLTIHLIFSVDNFISLLHSTNMTTGHLETVTREELIDLVLQLQDRVAELEARLVSKVCSPPPPQKPPTFLSLLFPIEKATVSICPGSGRKKAPVYGHVGKSRLRAESEVAIECKLEICPHCDADLRDVEQKVVGEVKLLKYRQFSR